MKLHLLRHCESEGNVLRRFISLAHHHPLTEKGRRQAAGLRDFLRDVSARPGSIWHSPALRTRETAEIVQGENGVRRLRQVDALHEVDVGTLEGRSEEETSAMSVFYETVTNWGEGDGSAKFEGGESLQDVLERADRVRESLLDEEAGELIVVSHCLFLCGLIPVLTGRRVVDYRGSCVRKGSWNLLEGTPGRMELKEFDVVSHQPEQVRATGGPYSPPSSGQSE